MKNYTFSGSDFWETTLSSLHELAAHYHQLSAHNQQLSAHYQQLSQLTTNYNKQTNKQTNKCPAELEDAWLRGPKRGLRVRQNGFNVH